MVVALVVVVAPMVAPVVKREPNEEEKIIITKELQGEMGKMVAAVVVMERKKVGMKREVMADWVVRTGVGMKEGEVEEEEEEAARENVRGEREETPLQICVSAKAKTNARVLEEMEEVKVELIHRQLLERVSQLREKENKGKVGQKTQLQR